MATIPTVGNPGGNINVQVANQQVDTNPKQIQKDPALDVIAKTVQDAVVVASKTAQNYTQERDQMIFNERYQAAVSAANDFLNSEEDEIIVNPDGSKSVQKKGLLFKVGEETKGQQAIFDKKLGDMTAKTLEAGLADIKNPAMQRKLIDSVGDVASRSKLAAAKHIDTEFRRYTNQKYQATMQTEAEDIIGYNNDAQVKQGFERISELVDSWANFNGVPKEVATLQKEKLYSQKLEAIAMNRAHADSNLRNGYDAALDIIYAQEGAIPKSVTSTLAHKFEKEQVDTEFLYASYGNLTLPEFKSMLSSKKSLTQLEKTKYLARYEEQQRALAKQGEDAKSELWFPHIRTYINNQTNRPEAANMMSQIVSSYGEIFVDGYRNTPEGQEVYKERMKQIEAEWGSEGVKMANWLQSEAGVLGYTSDKTFKYILAITKDILDGNTNVAEEVKSREATAEINFTNLKQIIEAKKASGKSFTSDDIAMMISQRNQDKSLTSTSPLGDKRRIEREKENELLFFKVAINQAKVTLRSAIQKGGLVKGGGRYVTSLLGLSDPLTLQDSSERYLELARFTSDTPSSAVDMFARQWAMAIRQMTTSTVYGLNDRGERVVLSTNGDGKVDTDRIVSEVMFDAASSYMKKYGAAAMGPTEAMSSDQMKEAISLWNTTFVTTMQKYYDIPSNVKTISVGNRVVDPQGDNTFKRARTFGEQYLDVGTNSGVRSMRMFGPKNTFVPMNSLTKQQSRMRTTMGTAMEYNPFTGLFSNFSVTGLPNAAEPVTSSKDYTLLVDLPINEGGTK